MSDAGLAFRPTRSTCLLPGRGPAFTDPAKQWSNLEVVFLEPHDQRIELVLEYRTPHPASLRVFDAAGKKLAEKKVRGERHFGDHAVRISIPKDGKAGLLRMTGLAHELPATLPLSTLPGEAAVLRSGGKCRIGGLAYQLAPPPGYAGQVHLQVGGPLGYLGEGPSVVRVTGSKGEVLLDSSVSGDKQRHTVRLSIDSTKNPPPWELFVAADVSLEFTGPEKLYAAPDRDRLQAVLKALPGDKR